MSDRWTTPWRFALCALAWAAALAAGTAHAGRSCEARRPTPQGIERGMALAERTARALEAEHRRSGARVVLLARAGQDLSKYGVHYSHLGWAYRTPEGPWRVAHKLNECGTAVGSLYLQGLGEFFMDDLWRYEAVWLVPAPEVQARLADVLADRSRTVALHQRAYSMVSYAWGTRYQQSNQWALETLALAMEPATVRTRSQAQAWLRFKGYEPAVLRIGPLTRLGGRVTAANVAFDDHPDRDRFADRIATVTVDSVLAWMPRAGLGAAPATLALDAGR
ncbi:DUF2145 domain-containing protein [Paracidovorax konjaci]|uniref:DUF2145 domain-containing protein n=1 Tax=Paracidovorax konjaci TaxID=32040 RepID=A0A1I1Y8M9_9BURK|nr:DUF2145 domain-containing protein [Paracidovorax konjaci]SFE15692.1 hypothetical protein SAMN04489710_11647 [Paracidovorax konjaci]